MSELEKYKTKILNESSITKIIDHYIGLKECGFIFAAHCPFHKHTNESPTLIINEQNKFFKCRECGVGGDVIIFVMKYKNFEFVQAMREIETIMN